MFLDKRKMFLSSALLISRTDFLFFPKNLSKNCAALLVFGSSKSKLFITKSSESLLFLEITENSAAFLAFLLIFFEKSLSFLGPNVIPPPLQIGERLEPCLACPVCFCLHGFLPPPLTSERSLVCATEFLLFA